MPLLYAIKNTKTDYFVFKCPQRPQFEQGDRTLSVSVFELIYFSKTKLKQIGCW